MTSPIDPATSAPGDTFTAVGEAVLDGQIYIAAPVPFTMAGISIRAQVEPGPEGRVFKVLAGPSRGAGFARFEKTCLEPVTFSIYRNGEPLQQIVVPPYESMTLNLNG